MTRQTSTEGDVNVQGENFDAFQDRMSVVIERLNGVSNVARTTGFSESVIRKWRLGQSDPSRISLIRLARAAGVSVQWLATGEIPELTPNFSEAEGELIALWTEYRQGLGAGQPATTAAQKFVREYNSGGAVGYVPGIDKITVQGLESLRRRVSEAAHKKPIEGAESTEFSEEFALIPRYDIQVSTGPGAHVEDEREVHRMAFRREWLRREGLQPERLVLVSASGDSMSPTIGEGDLLLVDTSRRSVQDDSIYVLRVEEEVIAKRLQRDWEGGLWVRSDSDHYSDQHISDQAAARLDVVGRVVWIGKRI